MVKMDCQLVCVGCGAPAAEIYRQPTKDVLRLLHCPICDTIVDKYVEYDPALVFVDLVLQHREAYRHVLFNTGPQPLWKLAVIGLLCDAYTLWTRYSTSASSGSHLIPSAHLEWEFYVMSGVAVLEALTFACVVLALTRYSSLKPCGNVCSTCDATLRAMIVASSGKLLAVPALIWGQSVSSIYLALTALFLWLSQVHAHQAVLTGMTRWKAVMTITVATIAQYVVRWTLLAYFV